MNVILQNNRSGFKSLSSSSEDITQEVEENTQKNKSVKREQNKAFRDILVDSNTLRILQDEEGENQVDDEFMAESDILLQGFKFGVRAHGDHVYSGCRGELPRESDVRNGEADHPESVSSAYDRRLSQESCVSDSDGYEDSAAGGESVIGLETNIKDEGQNL